MHAAVISYHSSPLAEPGSGDAGGMTVYIRRLAEALASRGVTTDVFTRSHRGTSAPVILSPGVRVVPVVAGPPGPVPKERLRHHVEDFVAGVRAFSLSQRLSYDLIHSHYWQSGLAATGLARAWSVPLVHSPHTLGRVKNRFLAPGDRPEPEVRLVGEDQVIDASDVLVASTDDELEQLACLYSASHDRLKVVHPGVDHNAFRPLERPVARGLLGWGDGKVMLVVGRIQRLKGIDLAIRALEELVSALDESVRLVIVGGASGPDGGAEVERLRSVAADLGVIGNIDFVGPQPHDRLPLFYAASDIVTVCSHSESFGLAALEAHACGTPVVGTAVGGLSHVVRDGRSGFLVLSRDPSAFAARLKTILSDPHLHAAFSREAGDSAAVFSWERAAASFVELYECLVREDFREICTC
ncbi:MAG: glycosyltransferase [Actinomycetota bacterium]|nr:glycosyltransferase [Actinomycetota bacterium]